ncbi:hypothetical protein D9V30_00015 [Mycetocola reblochoni]|uniref:Uncharacterized protein n=2 Tax=Mycetocola reblochoni TaxID=331618 RepID=A0A1R4IP32_9MICO|nr:hypothetical protein [Mycetocola reblochoni]RLP70858.1 hypothetical protein D9V30_00015 [Mycetocola reblochoni]SJN20993.1 hypothetical protein FM119_02550 [Mycetocola reblochoni REB411]
MATYTGTLTDCGFSAALSSPRVLFIPGDSAAGISKQAGRVIATKPVQATLSADGSFSVNVVSSEELIGARESTVPYTVRVEWLDQAGQYVGLDVYQVMLRAAGGRVADMVDPRLSQPAHVIVSEVEPAVWPVGWVWVDSYTGDARRKVS